MPYRFYQGQPRSATSALRKLNISRIALEIQTKSWDSKLNENEFLRELKSSIKTILRNLRKVFY